MKLALNEVVFSGQAWEAEELGTFRSSLEKTDKIKFAKFKDDKRVVIMITEKGQEAPNKQVVLSGPLSNMVKKAAATGTAKLSLLKTCLGLNVIKNDRGYYLVLPAGEIGESFSLEEVTKAAEFSLEETIA